MSTQASKSEIFIGIKWVKTRLKIRPFVFRNFLKFIWVMGTKEGPKIRVKWEENGPQVAVGPMGGTHQLAPPIAAGHLHRAQCTARADGRCALHVHSVDRLALCAQLCILLAGPPWGLKWGNYKGYSGGFPKGFWPAIAPVNPPNSDQEVTYTIKRNG